MRLATTMAVVAFGLSLALASSTRAEETAPKPKSAVSALKNVRAKAMSEAELKRAVGGEDGDPRRAQPPDPQPPCCGGGPDPTAGQPTGRR